jgi:acetyltransferase
MYPITLNWHSIPSAITASRSINEKSPVSFWVDAIDDPTVGEPVRMPEAPGIDRVSLQGLGELWVRRLRRPEDEAAFRRFGAALGPEDLRTRFAVPTLCSPALAERLWSLNGIAFAALDEGGEILAIGEMLAREVGLAVRSDLKRHGLGRTLLERIVRHAFEEGATELTATVTAENRPMLDLAQRVGFYAMRLARTEVSMRLCLP